MGDGVELRGCNVVVKGSIHFSMVEMRLDGLVDAMEREEEEDPVVLEGSPWCEGSHGRRELSRVLEDPFSSQGIDWAR